MKIDAKDNSGLLIFVAIAIIAICADAGWYFTKDGFGIWYVMGKWATGIFGGIYSFITIVIIVVQFCKLLFAHKNPNHSTA